MKQFFEQYGGVALGILALLVLIAMITPVGNLVKTSLQGTVHKFSSSINSQTDNITESMNSAFKNANSIYSTGSRVVIEGKHYIVIEQMDLNSYKVMETVNAFESRWNQNMSDGNMYDGSHIDNYLENTYYNSLPDNIKNAIVDTQITQEARIIGGRNSLWSWTSMTDEDGTWNGWWINVGTSSNPIWKRHYQVEPVSGQAGAFKLSQFVVAETRNSIVRKVYLPSVEEINKIVNLDDEKAVYDFFKSTEESTFWTRDVIKNQDTPLFLWIDSRSVDYPVTSGVTRIKGIRPVYTLDFSLLDVTLE